MKEIYLESSLTQVPKLLGQINKYEESPLYGCFDKQYWHYRTRDYPATIPQYAVLSLALLYNIKSKQNKWYKNKLIKKWAIAGILYWCKMQHKDGSFDEAYPGDHSQPATAFSSFFIAEAFDLLKKQIDKETQNKILSHLKKAANYIWNASESFKSERGDPEVSNHDAGSIVALYKIYQLTKEEKYKNWCEEMLNNFKKLQKEEGWFPEYGGADIGYSTTTIFFLANYYRLSKNLTALQILKKLVNFVSYFIHPDGSLGGEYGSRTTCFIMPSGFEILAEEIPLAKSISNKLLEGIKNKKTLLPENYDDANLCSFPFISFLQASLYYQNIKAIEKLPCMQESFTEYFNESKFYIIKNNDYYAIVSGMKGIIKIYKKKLIFSDTGFFGKIENESIFSGSLNKNAHIELGNNSIKIETNFIFSKFMLSSPLKIIIARSTFPVISKISPLKKIIKSKLRSMMMTNRNIAPIKLIKEIKFYEDKIELIDTIIPLEENENIILQTTSNFSNTWSYSGGLFQKEEDYKGEKIIIKEFPAELKRILNIKTGKILNE